MKKLLIILLCVTLLTIIISSTAFAAEPGVYYETDETLMVNIAIIILVPLAIAFIICSVWRSQMKTARIAKTACNYIPPGGFTLTRQEDTYLYQTRTRVKINKPPPPSSGRR